MSQENRTARKRLGRQAEGIAKAKERGIYRGRKPSVDGAKVMELKNQELGVSAIAKELGICRASVYRVMEQLDGG